MKILILNWRDIKNPKSGGAEIVTMEHAKAWKKEGHEVLWLCARFKGSKSREIIDGIEIRRMGNALTVYLLAPIFYFAEKKKFNLVIDEIHGIPFFTPLYVKTRIVVFIHEVAGDIWNYMVPFPLNYVGRALEHFYFKLYRNIVFCVPSNSTAEEVRAHGIKSNKIKVIHCGANNLPLQKFQKEVNPTFIFVSRLVKMKGIENVLKAFSIIKKNNDKACLWVVGSGEKREVEHLKNLAKELCIVENTVFFGMVSQEKKFELLRRAHILLHASVKEGWGLVVIEAASQMTPAVVYNVGGLRDSVQDGVTGVVVRKNSPDILAEAACKLLQTESLYKKYQENCVKWADSFRWSKTIIESVRMINDIQDKAHEENNTL